MVACHRRDENHTGRKTGQTMRFCQSAIFLGGLFTMATPAWAHLGHVGDLAGHGHLAGIEAIGAAAAIAAALAVRKLKKKPKRKETKEA